MILVFQKQQANSITLLVSFLIKCTNTAILTYLNYCESLFTGKVKSSIWLVLLMYHADLLDLKTEKKISNVTRKKGPKLLNGF